MNRLRESNWRNAAPVPKKMDKEIPTALKESLTHFSQWHLLFVCDIKKNNIIKKILCRCSALELKAELQKSREGKDGQRADVTAEWLSTGVQAKNQKKATQKMKYKKKKHEKSGKNIKRDTFFFGKKNKVGDILSYTIHLFPCPPPPPPPFTYSPIFISLYFNLNKALGLPIPDTKFF